MSNQEPPNPFEELQKQIQHLMRTQGGSASGKPIDLSQFADGDAEPTPPDAPEASGDRSEALERIRTFSLKPREIHSFLNRYVIRQDEAKKVLSVAVCDHYNHVRRCLEDRDYAAREYNKPNILLLGPTGVGKTYLIRNIAKLIGVPFVKADATKFSETGYVGNDVEDMIRDLNKVSNGDTELAQYGIVYIDEIDKIAGSGRSNGGKDVSGRGVQINLLKLMEETDVSLFSPTDIMAQMQAMMTMGGSKKKAQTLSTKHVLFIVSGAFDGLAEDVKKRVDTGSLGFGALSHDAAENDIDRYLGLAETRDFIQYGFEPEFIGRIPVRVACEALTAPDLAEILRTSEGSILDQFRRDFEGYGITFEITEEAIERIAEKAARQKTGARGLLTVLEKIFRDFKYTLPSTAIRSFEVDTHTIDDPHTALGNLKKTHLHLQRSVHREDIERFALSFEHNYGLTLDFTSEAADALIDGLVDEETPLYTLLEKKLRDFPHGLALIRRNTGQTHFTLDAEAVRNPDTALSQWIVTSFKSASQENK